MFYSVKDDRVTLKVKAQPSASRSEFAGLYGDEAIKIRLAAPAVEGSANKELIKFLSKKFKISKSSIIFKSGKTSKIKIVEFDLTKEFLDFVDSLRGN